MTEFTKNEHYMFGVSVKETIGMLLRCHNELHEIVMALQDRVLELELKIMDENNECSGL